VLNRHINHKFKHGGASAVDVALQNCMTFCFRKCPGGGYVFTLDLESSFAYNDGWALKVEGTAIGGVNGSKQQRSDAVAQACVRAIADLLIRDPWHVRLIERFWKNAGHHSREHIDSGNLAREAPAASCTAPANSSAAGQWRLQQQQQP
jgi:hypothetical protein